MTFPVSKKATSMIGSASVLQIARISIGIKVDRKLWKLIPAPKGWTKRISGVSGSAQFTCTDHNYFQLEPEWLATMIAKLHLIARK